MELSDWRTVLGQTQRTREVREGTDFRGARKLASVLDLAFLDPILGFFLPGVGDLAGSALGCYIVALALKKRMPAAVIVRMLLNLALDAVVGVVPVIGDLFDLGFRANRRNLALLEERHVAGPRSARDWAYVIGALAIFLGALAVPILIASWALGRYF